jgi:hypothetical protein
MQAGDCETKNDVLVHLVTWLEYVREDIRVGDWKQFMGFRRAFHYSEVWYNHKTTKWCFHTTSGQQHDLFTGSGANMGECSSLLELLDGVADRYCKAWKLKG